jgi:hypothetical protein
METVTIFDEAIQIIQHLDTAVYEAFIRGDITAECFQDRSSKIRNFQCVVVDMWLHPGRMNCGGREQ